MELSNDLVSQFVKVTNDTQTKKKETSMKGTVVKITDDSGTASYYVKIDGSDALTPINTLTDMEDGDRVVVEIENHTATVTGNITSPSARTDDLKDAEDKIVANTAAIGSITADYVKTGVIEVANGRITDLEAKNADIERLVAQKATIDDLNAANAEIEDLKANKADITSLDSKYVNIDYANVGEESIRAFYAKFGMMGEVTISNGKVTGTLVGVTINGDLIQAGTLVADKLVIRTEQGLLYKLNIDALKAADLTIPENTEALQNGLHGAIINDKTIVAKKIDVDDLVAFGATIGGFKIESDSVHSVVKESVNNTTRGIYMDNDGQFNVGDAFNFVKFYRDYKPLTVEPSNWSTTYRSYFSKIDDKYVRLSSDTAPTFEAGKYYEAFYKLAVSADEVMFGSSKKNIQTALDEVANSSISDVDVEYCKSESSTELLEEVKVEGIKTVSQQNLKGGRVSIKLQSDNLLLLPYDNNFPDLMPSSDATVTAHGITFKPNPDGSVSIWGTASQQTNYLLRNYHKTSSETSRIFVKPGTYTLGINTNASPPASVRIYSNKYKGTVAIYNGAPQTFTIDADSDDTLGTFVTFGITVTTAFRNVTENSPVIAYPIFNEGTTLKDFTTPKRKSLTDSVSFIPKQNCELSINEVKSSLMLDEDNTVISDNSLSSIHVDAGLNYRVVLSVLLNMDNPQWTTSSPTWEEGSYIWSRTKTTNADNTVSYSDPVCITGNTGASGVGVESIQELYYLSTSDTECINGAWSEDEPIWSESHYIWTKSRLFFDNGEYQDTTPILSVSMTDVNKTVAEAAQSYSKWLKFNDSIGSLIVGKDGTTLMKQTDDGWHFNFGDYEETINDIGNKMAYVNIGETEDKKPQIELGEADSDFKLKLTNKNIVFQVGSSYPTKVDYNGLNTEDIIVNDEFIHGGFVWKKRVNGHLGLSWKGADS